MSKSIKTSVIIPVYNERDYINKCLTALNNQTLPIDEIIVVDNNTDDGSVELAKQQFKNVKFLKQSKQGIVYARNTGFDAASNQILIKIDADSIVDNDWHETLVGDFECNNIDAWTGYVYSKELNSLLARPSAFLFNLFTFRISRLLFGSNMAMTKEAWSQIRERVTMRNDIWEDLDMTLFLKHSDMRLMVNSKKMVAISARSLNTTIRTFYKRLSGQTRVYWVHKRWLQFMGSLLLIHLEMFAYIFLSPFATIGKKLTKRPRPDQY